jgi:hypothetical protein
MANQVSQVITDPLHNAMAIGPFFLLDGLESEPMIHDSEEVEASSRCG